MSAEGTTRPALGPGMIVPRKRALFGLLDADGWGWATVKAFFWLVFIILILGYIPDRAYYFTVNRTIDLGLLVWSPINFCPSDNETLPCPAPTGAVVPWHASPPELDLPAARTDGTAIQLGTKVLYIGGSDGQAAQSTVYAAELSGTGNFDKWAEGPPLPEPRSDAAVIAISGTVFVVGGYGADGKPTTTAWSMTPDPTTGVFGEWTPVDNLTLPEARAGAAAVNTPSGMLLIGGVGPSGGTVNTTYGSQLDNSGKLGKWDTEAPMARPQADGFAAIIGDYLWVYGGHDDAGAVGAVQRATFGSQAPEGQPANPNQGKVVQWAISNEANLPAARDNAAGWNANGTLYLVGGDDDSGPQKELYWSIPTIDGNIPEWLHLPQSDLPVGLVGGSAFATGPNVVIVGGQTAEGVIKASLRANTAPQTPFFQLGPFGATVPGLKIDGEIGQQLGYANAAGAGTLDFIILIIIGWAFAHKPQARAWLGRVFRRVPR
jgi:N-acetylneuraminic acid mutarotase